MTQQNSRNSTQNPVTEAGYAFRGILSQYPRITLKDIRRFALVYYPIAVIEMELSETTYEDFETVQMTVLKLASLGVTDSEAVSRSLGLSLGYIEKMQTLLLGMEYLDRNGITDLGRRCIKEGKKITEKKNILQQFNVDPLNGSILKIPDTISEQYLKDADKTELYIGHINYPKALSAQDLAESIIGDKCRAYLDRNPGELDTNVSEIRDIRCVEIRYALCAMADLKGAEGPVVFGKRYDITKEKESRFEWRPMCVPGERTRRMYGFRETTPIASKAAAGYIGRVHSLIEEGIKEEDIEKRIDKTFESFCHLSRRSLRRDFSESDREAYILRSGDFREYTNFVLNFLVHLNKYGEYSVIADVGSGKILSFRSNDRKILALSKIAARKCEEHGFPEVNKALSGAFSGLEPGEDVFDWMGSELNKVEE